MVGRAAAAVVAAGFLLAASASAAEVAPWSAASNVRLALSDAQAALVLGDSAGANERLDDRPARASDSCSAPMRPHSGPR